MTGQFNTVKSRYLKALEKIKADETLKEYEIVLPVDMEFFDDEGYHGEDKPLSYYLSKDVELVLESDAIYSCLGWEESKGCNVERTVAKIYNLELFSEKM